MKHIPLSPVHRIRSRSARSAARVATALGLAVALASCGLFRTRPPVYPKLLLEGEVLVQDLVVPDDPALPLAEVGSRVTLDYEARVLYGAVLDSSLERGQPVTFTLGSGDMPLVGLERGVLGMRMRGRRRIVAPPELAFGEAGIPGRVEPDTTVEFIVELRLVEPPSDG